MILFPAIDLVGGRVVRLANGERSRMDVYSDDPAAVAEKFRDAGASWVHVVDLSATLEEDEAARAANDAAIRAICAVDGISVDAENLVVILLVSHDGPFSTQPRPHATACSKPLYYAPHAQRESKKSVKDRRAQKGPRSHHAPVRSHESALGATGEPHHDHGEKDAVCRAAHNLLHAALPP